MINYNFEEITFLENLSEDLKEELVNKTLDDTVDNAKKRVPVDTGTLRSNIKRDGNNKVVADTDYAALVHEGTVDTPPNPYMERAIKEALRRADIRFKNF